MLSVPSLMRISFRYLIVPVLCFVFPCILFFSSRACFFPLALLLFNLTVFAQPPRTSLEPKTCASAFIPCLCQLNTNLVVTFAELEARRGRTQRRRSVEPDRIARCHACDLAAGSARRPAAELAAADSGSCWRGLSAGHRGALVA